FGAPVFTRGYIKQYAQRVELDYAELLAEYARQGELDDLPIRAKKPIRLRDERQISQWILASLILTTLVVGYGIWYLASDAPSPAETTAPGDTPPDPGLNEETVIEPAALATDLPPEPTPAAEPAAPATDLPTEPTPAAEPAAPATALPTEPTPAAEPAPVSAPPPLPDTDPAPGSAPEPVVPADAEAPPPAAIAEPQARRAADPPPGPTVSVTISFDQDCWTEVTDARGERVFYGLGSAGAVSRFDAPLPLSFLLGNAAGVRLQLNGRPYAIPAGSRQGDLARFMIAEGF
ncbi:MAG: DUF4115 domain-containing protein, partial [Rhodospirillaceae bacterium]|nr:DUF4115 domain-containing protein [Rhodospirillaceae bacterium]